MNRSFPIGFVLIVVAATAVCSGCSDHRTDREVTVQCRNPLPIARTDELAIVDLSGDEGFAPLLQGGGIVALSAGEELPAELLDLDGNGSADHAAFLLNIGPKETARILLKTRDTAEKPAEFPKRTQAVLAVKAGYNLVDGVYSGGYFKRVTRAVVPPGHVAHDAYFKFEGPGWESDKVGYRMYLDARNRMDIWGKKVTRMVLQDVGNDDLVSDSRESYTREQDWGLDMFKVGESLGMGSFALWKEGKPWTVSDVESVSCRVLEDGIIYSAIEIQYRGWKVQQEKRNLNAVLSISAGSRLTRVDLTSSAPAGEFSTGLARHADTDLLTERGQAGALWGYLALWGAQSLTGDSLGTAIFFDPVRLLQIGSDEASHIVALSSHAGELTYYMAAAWDKEPDGIKTLQGFRSYLQQTARMLAHPLELTLEKPDEGH
jgi:hypothetical protein